ncbi:MAG: hypothetical protein ACUZ8E_04060 [Candidatus Anammoxibacter sp.]
MFYLLPQSCHSRRFLAGIQVKQASGYPIKEFGYDKDLTYKFLTGHYWNLLSAK